MGEVGKFQTVREVVWEVTFFSQNTMCWLDFEKNASFWSNYSDLTRPHPKWWFSKGNPLISGKSRLVKYYNLPRSLYFDGNEFSENNVQTSFVNKNSPAANGKTPGHLSLIHCTTVVILWEQPTPRNGEWPEDLGWLVNFWLVYPLNKVKRTCTKASSLPWLFAEILSSYIVSYSIISHEARIPEPEPIRISMVHVMPGFNVGVVIIFFIRSYE